MEYVGSSLCDILASALDSGKKEALVAGALSKLRALHEKGFAHGGAHIKNFTCFGKEIYMVDFEEVIPPGHLESFKTRDLLVFLLSMEACSLSPDLARICEAYGGKSGRAVREKLERELLRYRFLKFLNMKIFKHIKMNDVRAAISLIEKAEKTVA
jgi:tRNA A-37 threonylcarbamoyl transferase component Bud32